MGPIKRRRVEQPEALTFDPEARSDYLTGFHKRKVARIKHAKETAVKKDREERIKQRKELRDKRKADLERHVEEVNTVLLQQRDDLVDESDTEEFRGFEEDPPPIDKTDEYIDEDKYATVTIKELDSARDFVEDSADEAKGETVDDTDKEAPDKDSDAKRKQLHDTRRPKKVHKKRQFRYESKTERQATRRKNSKKNAEAAQARRAK